MQLSLRILREGVIRNLLQHRDQNIKEIDQKDPQKSDGHSGAE